MLGQMEPLLVICNHLYIAWYSDNYEIFDEIHITDVSYRE